MILRILQFINMFLLALVAGVFWGTWFSLSRSMPSITPSTFLEVGQIMIGNLALPMSILMPAAMISTFPVLFLLFHRRMKAAFLFEFASLLLFVVALVVTLSVNVPIDNEIKRWTLDSLPSDWRAIRDHWEFYHALRTFGSLAGLACVFGSVLCTHYTSESSTAPSRRPL